jgi:superfamily II DNA or RNA helicase
MNYHEFLQTKSRIIDDSSLEITPDINPMLFDFQRHMVEWALARRKAAYFADCGMGKTFMQLEYAKNVPGNVLIAAPLAVAQQTCREAQKLGLDAIYSRDHVDAPIVVTNYEMLDRFNAGKFAGVVLDESSILKSFAGKMKQMLMWKFKGLSYRLACTATPAPNDHMEIGNHAEFLGLMNFNEMLTRWFINDTANTGNWRLKGHAVKPFWQWVASWAKACRQPSDLGNYSDDGYTLPKLKIKKIVVDRHESKPDDGWLFDVPTNSATELHREKRKTIDDRVDVVAQIVNPSADQFLVWCESNAESEALKKAIPDAVEVKGSDSIQHKEDALLGFADGKYRVLVSKPSICGFGMNFQNCHNMIFASINYSYENFYQAVRRSYRFGQKKPVNVTVVISETEGNVWKTIYSKMQKHESMVTNMRAEILKHSEVKGLLKYQPQTKAKLPQWIFTA